LNDNRRLVISSRTRERKLALLAEAETFRAAAKGLEAAREFLVSGTSTVTAVSPDGLVIEPILPVSRDSVFEERFGIPDLPEGMPRKPIW
jgi:hypothetical protein